MRLNLTIRYKKPSRQEFLLWLILLLPFAFGTLNDLFGLPDFIKYACDLCWLGLLVRMLVHVPKLDKPAGKLLLWLGVFLLVTLFAYIFNYQSILYYLWGLRNNFRFYVFFFALIVYFRKEYIPTAMRLFDVLFWINAAVSLVQFFVLGLNQDFLGGIFGVTKGVNAYTNNFSLIVTAYSILRYLNRKESLLSCFLKCGTALVIAALAELKFFYIEFAVVVILASLITKFTWRKFCIIVGGVAGVILTVSLLIKIFPDFADFFTVESIWNSASRKGGYSASSDLNRLNSVSVLISRFMKEGWQQVLGLGLGNCDTSNFDFLNTTFYSQYSWLRYAYFSIAFMFLENGFAGLVFFLGFFVLAYFLCGSVKAEDVQDRIYIQLSKIISVCCLMIAVYNASLRQESSYMLYFSLALGFIASRKNGPAISRRRLLR